MRKYIRPMSKKVDVVSGLNETIFMAGSGDIWSMGPCFKEKDFGFHDNVYNTNGTITQIYTCRVYHDSNKFPGKHFNDGQNWVFYLEYQVPQGTVFTCHAGMESSTGILNDLGTGYGNAVRFVRGDDANNGPEEIGYSDLDITFDPSVFTAAQLTDILENGLFNGFGVNDFGLWKDNPNA